MYLCCSQRSKSRGIFFLHIFGNYSKTKVYELSKLALEMAFGHPENAALLFQYDLLELAIVCLGLRFEVFFFFLLAVIVTVYKPVV